VVSKGVLVLRIDRSDLTWAEEIAFDIGQDAAEIVDVGESFAEGPGIAGDISRWSIGRDYHQRDTEAVGIAATPELAVHVYSKSRRGVGVYVIVPASPVVPGDEDGGAVPIALAVVLVGASTVANGIHQVCDVVRASSYVVVSAGMVRPLHVRNHPAHLGRNHAPEASRCQAKPQGLVGALVPAGPESKSAFCGTVETVPFHES